jgi:carboxypeptidase Taq
MWENIVGRSRPFWTYWFPRFVELFPDALAGVDAERFYRAINRVEPSLIRVDADEVTYSLHVILRFELEQELIHGELSVSDLPGAWNERSRALLGIEPPTDAVGVLQDVHWSEGMFGYFPTYALGNVYSAQLFRSFLAQNPDFFREVERGTTDTLLAWLRETIHRHGKVYSASELIERVSGEPLNPTYFLEYVREKYADIYRL